MSVVFTPAENCSDKINECQVSRIEANGQLAAKIEHNRQASEKRFVQFAGVRPIEHVCRKLVLGKLQRLKSGELRISDRQGEHSFGLPDETCPLAKIDVANNRFYRQVALGGGLGAAESYIQGDWNAPHLTDTMRAFSRNMDVLAGIEKGGSQCLRPLRLAVNWLRRNTRNGSRRNISAHYDLSNEFFALMLDPTMTYSSGYFATAASSLQEASIEKYDRICRKLQLNADDHVLEIGTGWGGFAVHASKKYGCQVTTTTISNEQHAYAKNRFLEEGLQAQVTLLKDDYRDLCGKFTKLVSIEMIEAVGEKFLPVFFAKCSELLHPHGAMCLQAILLPDHRYASYRRSVDFIQRYIFPGGFLPSMQAIAGCVAQQTDFRFVHCEDFGPHYATTLAKWRERFWKNIESIRELGFDERFIRTWHYYLCYCEAGFREHQIGVAQLLLTKPGCRQVFC